MNLTSNRRAEEFHRLLESDVRDDHPVNGPLLAVADALRATPTVPGPTPEFRAALRQRLVAVATVQGVGAPEESTLQRARAAGSTWKVQRRLSALAAGAAVVTGIAGVGVGASRSLPGQPLYGVKRAAEDAQLATTFGTEARGKRHLEFARTRLAEVEALAGESSSIGPMVAAHALVAASSGAGRAKLIQETLRAMDSETRSGANDLFAAFRSTGTREPLSALNGFARRQYAKLHALAPALPPAARPAAASSLALLAVVADDTVRLAGPAAPGTSPGGGSGGGSTPAPAAPSTGATQPSSPTTQPSGSGTGPTQGSQPTQPTQPSTPTLPSSNPGNPVQSPSLPPIPPLPTGSPLPTLLPSELPTLPDLSGLLGN